MSRVGGGRALHPMTAQQGDQIRLDPCAKLGGRDATSIVLIAVQEAKDVGGEEFSNGRGHAGEAVDKEVDGIATIKVKRRARPILSVSPRVDVEHPSMVMSKRAKG